MRKIREIQPQIIYHLAAAGTAVGRIPLSIDDLIRTNTLGTIHLIEAAESSGCEYFINTGSSSEYGQKNTSMAEDDFLEPNNPYGLSKSGATQYASSMKQYKNFPIITYRLFAVYGPYEDMHRLIPTLCRHIIEESSPELSSPDPVRDFIYIEDVVEAYLRADIAIESPLSVINLGTGIQYSIDEVIRLLQKITGSSVEPHYGKKNLHQFEPRLWKSNPRNMQKILDLYPRPLVDGLSETLDWMRAHI